MFWRRIFAVGLTLVMSYAKKTPAIFICEDDEIVAGVANDTEADWNDRNEERVADTIYASLPPIPPECIPLLEAP